MESHPSLKTRNEQSLCVWIVVGEQGRVVHGVGFTVSPEPSRAGGLRD